jgi:SpoVK/Ycf46/Vps4 family AAA+-type ATPase
MSSDRIEALRAAVERDPGSSSLRLLLAEALEGHGDLGGAADEYERLLEMDGLTGGDLIRAGHVAIAADRLQLAGRCLERAKEGGVIDGVAELEERFSREVSGGAEEAAPAMPEWTVGDHVAGATFADVGGLDDVKRRIERAIILPFQRPDVYERYGRSAGAGVMLYGPPGCGKTLLARATAGECGLPFVNVRIEDVLLPYIGESERALHGAFEAARQLAPCVLFLDELDAIAYARRKQQGVGGRALVDQLLQELDSIGSDNTNVLILGATNAPWDVDDALKRPGRLDRLQFVPPPDKAARARIFEIFLADKPTESIDVKTLASKSPLFSGADIRAAVDAAVDDAIEESLASGGTPPVTGERVQRAIAEMRPTTLDWLQTARNYVEFANDAGRYDEVEQFLGSREAKSWKGK